MVRQNDEYIKSKPQAIQQAPAMQGAKSVNADYQEKLVEVESMSTEDVKYMQKDSRTVIIK
ncbi:hypothetical protein EMGBS15_16240 [Filimonas sp.]|nr:hypothetical protein EMGBS15_16240 [Filimonas sp.]